MGAVVARFEQGSIWYSMRRPSLRARSSAVDCILKTGLQSPVSTFVGFQKATWNISTMFCAPSEQAAYFTCGRSEECFIQLAELRVVRDWTSSDGP